MKRRRSAAFLLLSVQAAWAHHSFAAEFDASKPVHLQGVVARVEWVNPHAEIYLDVKGPEGKVVRWTIEAGSPNALLRRGFTKASAPEGTRVVVEGYQSKDGSPRANGREIILPGGRKVLLSLDAGARE